MTCGSTDVNFFTLSSVDDFILHVRSQVTGPAAAVPFVFADGCASLNSLGWGITASLLVETPTKVVQEYVNAVSPPSLWATTDITEPAAREYEYTTRVPPDGLANLVADRLEALTVAVAERVLLMQLIVLFETLTPGV